MIVVAFLYSLTAVLGKKAVLLSGPYSFPAIYYGIFFALLTPLACISFFRSRKRPSCQKMATKPWKYLLLQALAGVSFAIAIIFHFNAISRISVPFMISVKRVSLVISVMYGALLFKEKNIGFRLGGAVVMAAGILILAFI